MADPEYSADLLPHHAAWLAVHPNRTPEWLRERTRDGFDVHHLDGNHKNNDPLNLVLIEHADHMMIHGGRMMGRLRTTRLLPLDEELDIGRRAYEARLQGKTWPEIAGHSEERNAWVRLRLNAQTYARHTGKEWPVSIGRLSYERARQWRST